MMHSTTRRRNVYLIHFTEPYKHARHYLGQSDDLSQRLAQHQRGDGARLMQVVREAGIAWVVARTWQGGRSLEYKLKSRHNAPKELCPICRGDVPLSAYPLYS